jgi:hypothetical protein
MEATLTTNRPNQLGGPGPTARMVNAGFRRACRLSEAGVRFPIVRARARHLRKAVGVVHPRNGELAGRASKQDTDAAALAAGTEATVSRDMGAGRCEQ